MGMYRDENSQEMNNKNPNQSKLFVGTNQNGLIITIDISDLLEYENNIDYELMNATDANFQEITDKYEEEKQPDDEPYQRVGNFGPSDNIKKLDELTKNNKYIMQQQR